MVAHLHRYLDDAYRSTRMPGLDPAGGDALRAAAAAVRDARDARQASLDPALLARLRRSYDPAS